MSDIDACGHRYGWCCDMDYDNGTYRTGDCISRTRDADAVEARERALSDELAAVLDFAPIVIEQTAATAAWETRRYRALAKHREARK